jgi:ABC-type multidrug transport system fused ATPase/permease subunit
VDFFWDWSLSLVLLVLVIGTVLLVRNGGTRLTDVFQNYQRAESSIVGKIMDIFHGNRAVKLHAMEAQMRAAFEQEATSLKIRGYERDLTSHRVNMRSEAFGYLCFVLLCAVGTIRYLGGHLTEGQFVGFLAAYAAMQLPLSLLFTIGSMHGQARASFSRVRELLLTNSSKPDPPAANRKPVPARALIRVPDLFFAYQGNQLALKKVNLTIPFRERIALVGPSGSGKSTFTKLLLRLYDPDRGSICLGDVDLRRCRPKEIRERFGVVPQEPYFFAASVRENLQIMRPEASAEQLRRACLTANAWEFLEKLPEGLDTPIGEGGACLSGGQRQRLAIARALLRDPDYLIFDEATNALDLLSEKLVQQALEKSLTDRTAIFIAHRLATIRNCGRIFVLNQGCVVQDGTFEQLASEPGLFRQMVESDNFGAGKKLEYVRPKAE